MRAFLGTALHAPTADCLEVLHRTLFVVDDGGQIVAIHREESPDAQGFAVAQGSVRIFVEGDGT